MSSIYYSFLPGSTNTIDQLIYNPAATIPWSLVSRSEITSFEIIGILPINLWQKILDYLPTIDRKVVRGTSRKLKMLVELGD